MKHVTMIESTPGGYLGRCETCGDRNLEFTGYGEAHAWCDKHEHRAAGIGFNTGPRQPALRTLERMYRENSTNMVYTPEERAQWKDLADELRDEIEARNPGPLPGQMALWETEKKEKDQ